MTPSLAWVLDPLQPCTPLLASCPSTQLLLSLLQPPRAPSLSEPELVFSTPQLPPTPPPRSWQEKQGGGT